MILSILRAIETGSSAFIKLALHAILFATSKEGKLAAP